MNISEREPVTAVKVRFTLTGFDQDAGVRLYAFDAIADGIRSKFTVGVDLALMRTFGIQIQELPLLCREFLERQEQSEGARALTLGDKEMRLYADHCASARDAARKRKRTVPGQPS